MVQKLGSQYLYGAMLSAKESHISSQGKSGLEMDKDLGDDVDLDATIRSAKKAGKIGMVLTPD